MASPVVAAAAAAIEVFSVGERVQVWSNSRNAWLPAVVEAYFAVPTIADGYSVPAGTVRVRSEAGMKWIMPQDVAGQLRRVPGGVPENPTMLLAAGAGSPEWVGGSTPSSSSSAPAPSVFRPSAASRVDSKAALCKNGCGRAVQPGLTRGLKPYDTCCKRCAQAPGSGEHDENCGGKRLEQRGSGSAGVGPSCSLKELLGGLLRESARLDEHVRGVFVKVGHGAERLEKAQIANGLQELVAPFGVRLDIVDRYLSEMCARYSSNERGDLSLPEFLNLCRVVLEDRSKLWFPEVLPVSTSDFVKQNERPLEEVYTLGKKLGEGSFGTVFLVEHRISGMQRVCKKIRKSKSEMTSAQILREIGNMAMLDHPNVIKVYEYFDDAEYVSQIMEPCHGGELQDKVEVVRKTGKLPYDEAFICDVMKQTLRALAFMHNMRFMHKDLKPQNIMMVDEVSSSIKVIDFGLAELFNPQQEFAANIGGTLLYMAPEVFRQQMTVKVDVWSAGVILYNLLTGDYPFLATWPPPRGKTEAWWQEQTIEKIKHEPPSQHELLKQAAPDCIDLMMRMLQKDVQARPDAAQCLEHPWFRRYSGEAPTLSVGVAQCVEAFARMSELKKAMFLLIAHQCEVEALLELRALFTHFDVRNQGCLSATDLSQVLASSGMGPLVAERVIHALDRNGDGRVSWTEFTAAAICVSVCRNIRVVDAAFATFDADQDGKVSMEDILHIFASGRRRETWGTAWRRRLPDLFEEMVKVEAAPSPKPSKPARPTIGSISASLARVFRKEARATKEQFRAYVGKKLDFRAGDALYAVS